MIRDPAVTLITNRPIRLTMSRGYISQIAFKLLKARQK